ncbi:transcriptional regulator, TetR family [Acidisarcina polymorpha]|uniref:Transcriptional regulator, TetR family n=1 Tax=Acidisarcina polymorpha TaxID=2211140 RepID=A0A2Z5G487_9BACT|nr:TetR/AcrR family transcriptional regulator [Acidisarcina polymorpha]AXC14013.1 transcriptional regulator, TetR family [Acidisarcina polymorpha]
MVPKPKPSKRDSILDAMLDLVVERGFHDAPMSLLSKRSGASPGVIYHYFGSKEQIIQALYERIRALKIQAFLGGFSPDQDPHNTFLRGCLNIYNFYRKHKREMRFYEQYEHAGFACTHDAKQEDERAKAYARCFSSKSKGGVLNEWPAEVVQEMTLNLVIRLASQPRKLPEPLLLEIAEGMWQIVKSKE